MIGSARFQNLKALKDVSITFESRLTILVGPNGSGKTTVLRALNWLCQMTHENMYDGEADKMQFGQLKTWHGGGTDAVVIEFQEVGSQSNGVRGIYSPPPGNIRKAQWFSPDGKTTSPKSDSVSQKNRPSEQSSELIDFYSHILAAPSKTTSMPPIFGEEGDGLASLMAYFKLYDEAKFDQIQELFCSLIRQVKRIRIGRVQNENAGAFGEELLFDLADRKGVPASAMSDGTLYALGLIAKILDPQRPRVLFIDDIEHGFHPRAQLRLVEMLKKLLDEIPDLQIIATTHSPFILDKLEWNEVRVSGVRDDGSVEILPITDHPEIGRWKEDMTPGEFWATFFENWVTQPKPELQPV